MSANDNQFQRAGAVSPDGGKSWVCRGCGLPVESTVPEPKGLNGGDGTAQIHGVPIAFYAMGEDKDTATLWCSRRIGKVVDMVAHAERRRKWLLEVATESWALPEYLRQAVTATMALTAKPRMKTVTLWYLEVRQTMRHAVETCPKRPPLSKRAEQAAKTTLSRTRWA